MADGQKEDGCQESKCSENITDEKFCDTSTQPEGISSNIEPLSKEDINDTFANLKNLSLEQFAKFAEETIGNDLKSELERKHKRELLLHVLLQKEEKNELRKKLKLERMLLTSDDGFGSKLPTYPQMLSQISEMGEKCESLRVGSLQNGALLPELSPCLAETPLGVEGEYNSSILSAQEQELSSVPDLSVNDSVSEGIASTPHDDRRKQDILLRQIACCSRARDSNFMYLQSDSRKRGFSSCGEEPGDTVFDTVLFKTEMCRRWTEYGYCPYGVGCRFAHGAGELRMRPISNKNYKTVWCKKFLAGYCPYGTRCCFVHDISELRIPTSARRRNVQPGRVLVPNNYEHGAYASSNWKNMGMIPPWRR